MKDFEDKNEDSCVSAKYIMTDNDNPENNDENNNIFPGNEEYLDSGVKDPLKFSSESMKNYMKLQNSIKEPMKNSEIYKDMQLNMVIHSNKNSEEMNDDNSIDNYIEMENNYLEDGKINHSQTDIMVIENSEKDKALNNAQLTEKIGKIKEKISHETNIKQENTSSINTNNKDANSKISNNLVNIPNDNEIKYNTIYSECKQKLRDDKANLLKEEIKSNLKPKIINEIYKNEYNNILSKIRKEIEQELYDELEKKKNQQITYLKKKENYKQKCKFEQIENDIRQQITNEFNEDLQKDLNFREKQLQIKYTQKLNNYRIKLEKDLNENFNKNKRELTKQINEIKSNIYRSRCAEKLKINKIQNMKKNIGNYNIQNSKGVKKIDKILGNDTMNDSNYNENLDFLEKKNITNAITTNSNNITPIINETKTYYQIKNSVKKSNNNLQQIMQYSNDSNSIIRNDESYERFRIKNTKTDNSVNLQEINKQIKLASERGNKPNLNRTFNYGNNNKILNENRINNINNINDDNSYVSKYMQKLKGKNDLEIKTMNILSQNTVLHPNNNNIHNNNIKNNMMDNVNKENNNNIINIEENKLATSSDNISPEVLADKLEKITPILKNNENQKFILDLKKEHCFFSLKTDKKIPTKTNEFGNYLINHIEKEENYKILYFRELQKFKNIISKIFKSKNKTDHCLTEYMMQLWDKLEVSFYMRYQILKELVKLDCNNLYSFLDRETEYLTSYYEITENIFKEIKLRENLKSKLQFKSSRNQVILPADNEQLQNITDKLFASIKNFKNNYGGINIVWKGLFYEWFMNYEKWFYEMENTLDNQV